MIKSESAYNKFLCVTQHDELRTDRIEGDIKGFTSGGVTCKLEVLYVYSSVMKIDSFVLRNPPERKSQNRKPQL